MGGAKYTYLEAALNYMDPLLRKHTSKHAFNQWSHCLKEFLLLTKLLKLAISLIIIVI